MLYNVEFEDDIVLNGAYLNNVRKLELNNAITKFNIFDIEICHVGFGTSDKAFMNNINLNVLMGLTNNKLYQYIPRVNIKYVRKHNFTNDNLIKQENTEELTGDSSEVCVVIDKTASTKEMHESQKKFVECLQPKYIIVLTENTNKLQGNVSFRNK